MKKCGHEHLKQIKPTVEWSTAKNGSRTHLDKIPGDVATGDVEPARQMWKREAIIDGTDMRYPIARVDDDTGQKSYVAEFKI